MKKIIFAISLIIFTLFFSFTCVYATENNMDNVKNNIVDTANNAGNVVKDTTSGAASAINNGLNAIGNTTQNMSNDAMNGVNNAADNMMNGANTTANNMNSDFTATRTSTEGTTDGNNSWTNNIWTWIIIGIIVVATIGIVWYFVNQNNR